MKYLHTSDLARAVGIHPNTVRRYADRGLLPPVTYSRAGYRQFTERHLDSLRIAWQVYGTPPPSLALYRSGAGVVEAAASGDLGAALERAQRHLAFVQAERAQAEVAADLMERWAFGALAAPVGPALQIGQVARLLNVTLDVLRNWDRNGLIEIPRDPANGYRRYGAREISRLRIIRLLSQAGYSLAAILRMLLQLDQLAQGETTDLRRALDTPRPDEDIYTAADRWISTLTEQEHRAHSLIALIEEIQRRQAENR